MFSLPKFRVTRDRLHPGRPGGARHFGRTAGDEAWLTAISILHEVEDLGFPWRGESSRTAGQLDGAPWRKLRDGTGQLSKVPSRSAPSKTGWPCLFLMWPFAGGEMLRVVKCRDFLRRRFVSMSHLSPFSLLGKKTLFDLPCPNHVFAQRVAERARVQGRPPETTLGAGKQGQKHCIALHCIALHLHGIAASSRRNLLQQLLAV
ncbi:hypothetical protein LX32DRAFT_1080 [Colletotrichum zoysiae]|uniref:Uncharacterized protein n=1 Tax=Colletotrichum zoysiae TaxID=1216348 RepID=A0AAD9M9N5_9PEZI|nr:hypothetical protein LX32DRAFT_1080 [Colletotrichum zoysiae]